MTKEELENIAIERVGRELDGDTFVHDDVVSCTLSDAEDCYVLGYKDAIDKACEWIVNHLPSICNTERGRQIVADNLKKEIGA